MGGQIVNALGWNLVIKSQEPRLEGAGRIALSWIPRASKSELRRFFYEKNHPRALKDESLEDSSVGQKSHQDMETAKSTLCEKHH